METQHLRKIEYGVRWLFLLEHAANKHRSRFWYMLPLFFNLPGGLVSFFAIRHDDMDKAKNCLLLGILLFTPLLIVFLLVVL